MADTTSTRSPRLVAYDALLKGSHEALDLALKDGLKAYRDACMAAGKSEATPALTGITHESAKEAMLGLGPIIQALGNAGQSASEMLAAANKAQGQLALVCKALAPMAAPQPPREAPPANPFASAAQAPGGGKGTTVEDTGPGHMSDRDAASDSAWFYEHVTTVKDPTTGERKPRFAKGNGKQAWCEALRESVELGVAPPVWGDGTAFGAPSTAPVWQTDKREKLAAKITARFAPRVTTAPIVDDGE